MKNLINSTSQRNIITVMLIIAIFALTLPAFSARGISFNFFSHDEFGVLMMIGLVLSLIIIFFREEFHSLLQKKLEKNFSENIIVFTALLPVVLSLWNVILTFVELREQIHLAKNSIEATNSFFGGLISISGFQASFSIGFYLEFLSLVFVIILTLFFPQFQNLINIITKKIHETNAKHKHTSTKQLPEKSVTHTENQPSNEQ